MGLTYYSMAIANMSHFIMNETLSTEIKIMLLPHTESIDVCVKYFAASCPSSIVWGLAKCYQMDQPACVWRAILSDESVCYDSSTVPRR